MVLVLGEAVYQCMQDGVGNRDEELRFIDCWFWYTEKRRMRDRDEKELKKKKGYVWF